MIKFRVADQKTLAGLAVAFAVINVVVWLSILTAACLIIKWIFF